MILSVIEEILDVVSDVVLLGYIGKDRYQTSGNGIGYTVDKKATREYYKSEEGMKQYLAMKHQLEFETLLMSYVMMQDDNRLSSDEISLFKDHLKQFGGVLSVKEFKELRKLLKSHSKVEDIIKYAQLNDLDNTIIERGFGLLNILNQVTGRYGDIIVSLKRQFQHHMDYII